jgi:hypothetical protein
MSNVPQKCGRHLPQKCGTRSVSTDKVYIFLPCLVEYPLLDNGAWTLKGRKTKTRSFGSGPFRKKIAPSTHHSLGLASIGGSDRRKWFALSNTGADSVVDT